MYFSFSKVMGTLLAPLNLIAVLFAFGALLMLAWPKTGRWLMGLGAGLFLFIGVLPVGHNAMVWLESRYERPVTMPGIVNGILMLGGSIDTHLTGMRPGYAMNEQGERIIETMILAAQYPTAEVMFSGGNNSITGTDLVPETDYIRDMIAESGLIRTQRAMIFEEFARNTEENINNSLAYMMANNMDRGTWIIVTSAYHMPRTAALIESSGWQAKIIYWPVDYRTDGHYRYFPQRFDVLQHMKLAGLALHEGLGWLTYRLTGKI